MTISEPSQRAVAEADRANNVNGLTLLTLVFNWSNLKDFDAVPLASQRVTEKNALSETCG